MTAILASELTFEDRFAAWLAGYDTGYAHKLEDAIDDQVNARLHTQALEALGMAKRFASVKGPAWTKLIEESGERDE